MYEFPIKYKGAKEENVIENMAAFSMNELWVTTYLSQILRGQYAWGKKSPHSALYIYPEIFFVSFKEVSISKSTLAQRIPFILVIFNTIFVRSQENLLSQVRFGK